MSDSILLTSLVLSIIYPFLSIFCYPLFIHIIYPLCMIYTKEVGQSDRLLFKKPLSLPLFEKRPIVLPSSSLVLNIYIYFFLSKKYFILFYILSCWREGENVYFQNKLLIFCLSWVGKENRRPHQRIYSHFPFKLKNLFSILLFSSQHILTLLFLPTKF